MRTQLPARITFSPTFLYRVTNSSRSLILSISDGRARADITEGEVAEWPNGRMAEMRATSIALFSGVLGRQGVRAVTRLVNNPASQPRALGLAGLVFCGAVGWLDGLIGCRGLGWLDGLIELDSQLGKLYRKLGVVS
jgi:hypothetical protein